MGFPKNVPFRRLGEDGVWSEPHTLPEWNKILGYEEYEPEVIQVKPEDVLDAEPTTKFQGQSGPSAKEIAKALYTLMQNQPRSGHNNLTPCFECGEVYGPGMHHHCKRRR